MQAHALRETAEPGYVRWEAPGLPAVVIRRSAADGIQIEVLRALNSVPKRGAEAGGILLGRRTGSEIHVEEFEPAPCEHRFGPSYRLSEPDRYKLEQMLAQLRSEPRNGLAVVGFFRSDTRTGFALDAEDESLFAACFPDPAQVFLLIKPNRWQQSVADFFFRRDGELRQSLHLEVFPFETECQTSPESIAEPVAEPAPPSEPLREPEPPQAWQAAKPPAPEPQPLPAAEPPAETRVLPPLHFRDEPDSERSYWGWGAAAAVVVILAAAWGYQNWKPSGSAPVPAATTQAHTPAPTGAPPAATPPAPPAVTAETAPPPPVETPKAEETTPPATAAPQAEAPAEAPPAPEPAATSRDEIAAVLDRWSASIRRGEPAAALRCYAPRISNYYGKRNAKPADVRKRLEYQRGRNGRLVIHRISGLSINPAGKDTAIATFTRHWQTAGRKKIVGEDQQRMTLVLTDSGWKIAAEEQTRVNWTHRDR